MFQITVTSLGSIIVFSFCFALFLAIALRCSKLLGRVKYELLLFCLLAPIIKILIPTEILPWTHNINVPYVLPQIVIFSNKKLFTIGGNDISIWEAILVVLLVVSIFKVAIVLISYRRYYQRVEKSPEIENAIINNLITKILAENGKKLKVSVKSTDDFDSPSVFGLFKPTILMPEMVINETELESVLRHELAHYLHGDLIMRFIWLLIKNICWWNPAVYILDGQLEKLLEIRADENAMVKQEDNAQDNYMNSLISLGKEPPQKDGPDYCASFQEKSGLTIRKRVEIILHRCERGRIDFVLCNLIVCLLVIGLTIAMNCLIFEPVSQVPEEDMKERNMVTEGNSFFIKNADGTYDMYYKGRYCTTLEDTQGTDLPVYESLEEAMKYEEIE